MHTRNITLKESLYKIVNTDSNIDESDHFWSSRAPDSNPTSGRAPRLIYLSGSSFLKPVWTWLIGHSSQFLKFFALIIPCLPEDKVSVFIFRYALPLAVFVPGRFVPIWSVAFQVTHFSVFVIALSGSILLTCFKRPFDGLLTAFEPRSIRSISLPPHVS